MKHRSSEPAASTEPVTQEGSSANAPSGRRLIFWFRKHSAILDSPNLWRVTPSTRSYHPAVASTSRQFNTIWSKPSTVNPTIGLLDVAPLLKVVRRGPAPVYLKDAGIASQPMIRESTER